ncbi:MULTISPECIES: hypothetical protein [unclassified Streptomyces]|uniref:hypothetical protein n=1 Tax=unclassified Streptomyces TaxID=2593676 RepID=UPI002E331C37|nr:MULTISPECIES: hypothetical protein [unclassified Streptomyces]WUC68243.1 hypothetical protein OG861_30575 [Streptomyces sp. NBC_00539]
MPATLPVPVEMRLPEDWLPAKSNADVADEVAFAAGESVERLRHIADSVEVIDRREAGPANTPALTQHVSLRAGV